MQNLNITSLTALRASLSKYLRPSRVILPSAESLPQGEFWRRARLALTPGTRLDRAVENDPATFALAALARSALEQSSVVVDAIRRSASPPSLTYRRARPLQSEAVLPLLALRRVARDVQRGDGEAVAFGVTLAVARVLLHADGDI